MEDLPKLVDRSSSSKLDNMGSLKPLLLLWNDVDEPLRLRFEVEDIGICRVGILHSVFINSSANLQWHNNIILYLNTYLIYTEKLNIRMFCMIIQSRLLRHIQYIYNIFKFDLNRESVGSLNPQEPFLFLKSSMAHLLSSSRTSSTKSSSVQLLDFSV